MGGSHSLLTLAPVNGATLLSLQTLSEPTMNGYPYQRLAKPTGAKTPASTDVGMMLSQRYGGQPMADPSMVGNPQAGAMAAQMGGMGGMPEEEGFSEEMVEGGDAMTGGMPMPGMDPMAPQGPMGPSPMAQAMMMRLPAQGMAGDYDPSSEHSPSSTRIALEQAALRMAGRMQGSETRITPSNTRELLTKLGIPPLELQLMEQSGQLGDTGGM